MCRPISKSAAIRHLVGMDNTASMAGWMRPHLEVTAVAGRALATLIGPASAHALAALSYVSTRQHADGFWDSYWWISPHYPTLEAIRFALSMGEATMATRAANWFIRKQERHGGWSIPGVDPSPFATAMALSALALTAVDVDATTHAAFRLASMQDVDGSWQSHPMIRIPSPGVSEPNHVRAWRSNALGTDVVIADPQRLFTTAACVGALARFGSIPA